MALLSGTISTTPAAIISAKVRRGLRITVKSGGPVAFAYSDSAPELNFANGDTVATGGNSVINNSCDASNAIWAVAKNGTAQWSAEEFF